MSEWKPGDVAVVSSPKLRRDVVIYRTQRENEVGEVWVDQYGYLQDSVIAEPRPLVVIDPEDREQVELLVDQFMGQWSGCEGSRVGTMQGVLRVFAGHAKPEEPTGLGAVVEDTHGQVWIRADASGSTPWTASDAGMVARWVGYARIAAVKVLSDGVQP
jgi:hypothetical protein